MKSNSPESLGITSEHIIDSIQQPHKFSTIVTELANDCMQMRKCRDALIAGSILIDIMVITCNTDKESIIKEII